MPDVRDKLEGDTARWAKLAKELDIKPLDGDEKKARFDEGQAFMYRIRR